jgi:hypothetical protein
VSERSGAEIKNSAICIDIFVARSCVELFGINLKLAITSLKLILKSDDLSSIYHIFDTPQLIINGRFLESIAQTVAAHSRTAKYTHSR